MTFSEVHGYVLSIQSHVVHGIVGNKSAVFPLQLHGFNVDFVNSVQFSNHTGYPEIRGQKLSGCELEELMQGLHLNTLDTSYTHVLTGYIGTESFLKSVIAVIRDLKVKNKDLVYVCDPVLGDNGKLYVPEELVEIYRMEVLKIADVMTPNQFEAERLRNKPIRNIQECCETLEWFHEHNVGMVVLTSAVLDGDDNVMHLFASKKGKNKCYHIQFPRKTGYYTGTGDLLTALILAWTKKETQFHVAIEKAINGIQGILKHTKSKQELPLIQCREILLQPEIVYRASTFLRKNLEDIR